MAGHNLKSASITNLDANPIVANTVGQGAPGPMRNLMDFVTTVSADDTTSTYRLCRFPTSACVKTCKLWSAIASAGSGDVDIAFSDSTTDGTSASLNALANPVVQVTGPTDNKLFGSAQSLVLSSAYVDFTFKGTYTIPMQNIQMWNNLVGLGATQFTADPGGFFDIYVKITTGITTGGILAAELTYVE